MDTLKFLLCIEISAVHKESGRKSAVTNVNTVIGEILLPILNEEDEDIEVNFETWICISDRIKHEQLVEHAERCLKDGEFVKYLENMFDEDMQQGGWNSGMSDDWIS